MCWANPDVPDDSKQANEAAEDCTPRFVSPLPIRFLGHPAVRPDVLPEGSWLHHCEAAQTWMWVLKHRSLIGIKWAALVAMRFLVVFFFFLL